MKKNSVLIFGASLCAMLSFGCGGINIDKESVASAWNCGDAALAHSHYSQCDVDGDENDILCYYLEKGTFALAAQDPTTSCVDFLNAENIIGGIDDGPVIVVADMIEGSYRGTNTERIMLGVMHSIALMEVGDFDNAGAILRKTKYYQDSALKRYEEAISQKIESLKEEENQEAGKIDVSLALKELPSEGIKPPAPVPVRVFNSENAEKFLTESQIGQLRKVATESVASAIYTNPYAYWLSGIYFLNMAETVNEKSEAAKLIEKAVVLNGANSEIMLKDLADAEKYVDGTPLAPATYIICENGSIAKRGYDDFVIPATFLSAYIQVLLELEDVDCDSTLLPNMTIRIPKLVPAEGDVPLPFPLKGAKYEEFVNLDEMKIAEFEQTRSVEITSNIIKASIACALRFVAQQVAAQQNSTLFAFASASAMIPTPAFPVETRGWESLPRSISVAKIPTPESAVLNIAEQDIHLKKTGVNIVRIRNVEGNPIVNVISFGK